jgi:hypothetical protein
MPQPGIRRSGRISKDIAITLIGSDMDGRVFSERTHTVVLSRHGAGITSCYILSAEQELLIRNEESNKEIEARIVGQIGSHGNKYIYGVAFLGDKVNFWGVEFPEMSDTEKLAEQILLECSSCHTRVNVDLSDLASDVMAVNESIVRYCRSCSSSTLWKHAAPGSTPSGDAFDSPSALTSPPSVTSWREPDRPSFAPAPKQLSENPRWIHADAARPAESWGPSLAQSSAMDVATIEAPSAATQPAVVTTKEPQENRRRHARTRVKFKACVRRASVEDDIVECEDMSRGGLSFKSSKQYFEKMLIEVAVPYSRNDQAIFVPAQIAFVQELPEQNLYRCGVTYLRSR